MHHEIAIKNMIHGPCGTFNPNSPCMAETITGNCGYPLYRRRSTALNGRSTIVKVNQQDIEINNSLFFKFFLLTIPIQIQYS